MLGPCSGVSFPLPVNHVLIGQSILSSVPLCYEEETRQSPVAFLQGLPVPQSQGLCLSTLYLYRYIHSKQLMTDCSSVDQCDRVKPCHACCAHGYPSKCVYEPIPGDDPIPQADEIRNLRLEIHDLRCRIDNQGN